jgi:oligopeptide transport system substrate-binding protein
MWRTQKRFALALILGLLGVLLAACGGPAAPAGTGATAAPGGGVATAAPSAGEATAAPSGEATAAPSGEATAAPSTGGAPQGNIIRINPRGGTWPDTLDPQKAQISNEIAILQFAYEGLTRFDKDLKTVPAAAEKWEYAPDAKTVTFHLRDGLKYSDGSPLTAQDFINAVYRVLSPINPGDYQTSLDMIEGADAIINTAVPTDTARLPELNKQLGVTAPDDKTLVFKLTRPTPYFHTLAALWVMYPAKQELVEKGGETWWERAENQVGNGPFKFTKIDRSANLIEMAANETYWAGRPKLDGIQFKLISDPAVALQAYKNGEIDIFQPDPNDVPAIKADPALSAQYMESPGACTESYELNVTTPPFDNKTVRQAFAYGFDRDGYIRDALKGTSIKTLTWIPPGIPGYEPTDAFDYNPEKGRQLLAEAGYPNGQGLPEIKWAYNSSNAANQARVEYIVQMYQKSLGVTIVPDPIEGTTLNNLRKEVDTHPQIMAGGWCSDYPDPQNWLSLFWISDTGFAHQIGYKNEQVDQLLQQADVEINPEKRLDLYAQAQRLIIDDQAYIIRSNSKNFFLIKEYVKGIEMTAQDSDVPGGTTGLFNVTLAR